MSGSFNWNKIYTILSFIEVDTDCLASSFHVCWQLGQLLFICRYLLAMLCRMEAYGDTPIPLPINTTCSLSKISLVDVPKGPSKYTCK